MNGPPSWFRQSSRSLSSCSFPRVWCSRSRGSMVPPHRFGARGLFLIVGILDEEPGGLIDSHAETVHSNGANGAGDAQQGFARLGKPVFGRPVFVHGARSGVARIENHLLRVVGPALDEGVASENPCHVGCAGGVEGEELDIVAGIRLVDADDVRGVSS